MEKNSNGSENIIELKNISKIYNDNGFKAVIILIFLSGEANL